MMATGNDTGRRGGPWSRIAELTGLDPDLLAAPALDRWIESRASLLGLALDDYEGRLVSDEAERRLFAAQVAVPESWVGRYVASFEVVAAIAACKAATGGVLRAVSIGCAAGQELVSVAITALDAGLPATSLELHGVDRNAEAIARARSGVLPMLAMRGDLAADWSSRFRRVDDGWSVAGDVHGLLRFHESDALLDPWPVADGTVDLVLCRNVLIYLSGPSRTRLIDRAEGLLAPDGVLLVGHADPPSDLRTAFVPLAVPGAFGWRRRGEDDPLAAPARSSLNPTGRPPAGRGSAPNLMRTSGSPGESSSAPAAPRSTAAMRTEVDAVGIRELADRGELERARIAAESLVEQSGSTADLECLLGEIASAENRSAAAREHWRRALYLAPDHEATLEHLAALCESSGEIDSAAGYRRRLARLAHEEEGGP